MIDKAKKILEKHYGYKSFRPGQEEVISNILGFKDILAIMPTGGGKSICYQIPALLLDGVTIVISPLISLMKDQVDDIRSMGIKAAYINSSLSDSEFNEILSGLENNIYKIIYIAPERLQSFEFLNIIEKINISQIAIDEAHCVSQWGHDFRVSYRKIANFIRSLSNRPIVSAFTATASKEVRLDIVNLLNLNNPKVFITGFDRENLSINIIKNESKKSYLLNYIEDNKEQSGIIYAATRKEVDNIYEGLKKRGYNIGRYHAGLNDNERTLNQEEFIHDRIPLMVATNAFGMGIDKPNIRFVIHYNIPQNIEAYYQEIGRAGRDGEKSECILLFSPSDIHIQKYLIEISSENPERKNNQYKKLQQMVDFVYSNDCYRKFLLNYFGEEFNENCNNCSNCLNEGDIVDRTIDAQKILSCICRMKKHFGITMLIDVLRGSKNKKVLSLNFNELSTYGLMREYSAESLRNFINTLISHNYITLIEGTYPVLALNENSVKVLKSQEKVEFKEFKIQRKITDTSELFNLLKNLRHDIAESEHVPPYMIFGDGTLREMSCKYPINKEAMLDISGVGEIKYEKYGQKFEELIKQYVKDNNIKVNFKPEIQEKATLDTFNVNSDLKLLEELLVLRKKFARKEHTIPRMIVSKNSLKEISGRYPCTVDELKDISGIGPKKIEKYGDEILEIVNNYITENNINRVWTEKNKLKVIIDGENRKNEDIAIDMLKDGKDLENISEEIEVGVSTILGYVTDYIVEKGELDFKLDIDYLYSPEDEEAIIKVCEKDGYDKISKVKKELPDTISYESIRAVILKKYFLL